MVPGRSHVTVRLYLDGALGPFRAQTHFIFSMILSDRHYYHYVVS